MPSFRVYALLTDPSGLKIASHSRLRCSATIHRILSPTTTVSSGYFVWMGLKQTPEHMLSLLRLFAKEDTDQAVHFSSTRVTTMFARLPDTGVVHAGMRCGDTYLHAYVRKSDLCQPPVTSRTSPDNCYARDGQRTKGTKTGATPCHHSRTTSSSTIAVLLDLFFRREECGLRIRGIARQEQQSTTLRIRADLRLARLTAHGLKI